MAFLGWEAGYGGEVSFGLFERGLLGSEYEVLVPHGKLPCSLLD